MDKLPVLYAPLFGGELDTNGDEVELVRMFIRKADTLIEHTGEIAEYIPARRCKTCKHWLADRWCSSDVPGADELGGSGFCHNYEPREI